MTSGNLYAWEYERGGRELNVRVYGQLVRVLDEWCEPFDGHYLYYPGKRQPSAAFSLLVEALRYREWCGAGRGRAHAGCPGWVTRACIGAGAAA